MTKESASRTKLLLAFTAIYVIWGSTYLAIRYAVETIPPFFMMGMRALVAGIILYVWSRARGDEPARREHWKGLTIIAMTFFLVGHGILGWSELHIGSGLAALLVASEPLWMVSIESYVLRDARVGKLGVFGLILGFIGMLLLVVPGGGLSVHGEEFWAMVAIIVGTMIWSGGAIYARVAPLPKSPIRSASLELIIGGVMLILFSLSQNEGINFSSYSLFSILNWAYLVVFGSIIAFTAYMWLLTVTSATRISTHTYVNPIIAVFLGWLIGGEQITGRMVVAAAVIVVSVYLVLKDHMLTERAGSRNKG